MVYQHTIDYLLDWFLTAELKCYHNTMNVLGDFSGGWSEGKIKDKVPIPLPRHLLWLCTSVLLEFWFWLKARFNLGFGNSEL